MPRCLAAATIAAIALFAAAPDVRAASFDCSRAAKGVETAICDDRGLSALDDQMAQNYRALLNKTSGATESRIKADQKNWLRQRNACGDDARCLNREYRARIQNIAASADGSAPRETAAVPAEEKPRGLFGRNARAPEAAKPEQTEEKPGLLARMIDRMKPDFGRKDEEVENTEPARRQTAQQEEPAAPGQPLNIVGQRPTAKTVARTEEPLVPVTEPVRQKTLARAEPKPEAPAPEPVRQKAIPKQDPEPQVAAVEPVRKKFALQPTVEQVIQPEPVRTQIAARDESKPKRKWEDLPTGSSIGGAEPALRVARTEPDREADAPRVKTTRVKPEPIEDAADRPLTSALTYVPENDGEAPAQRILRQEPRVQMIKPLIVRDRPPAVESSAPSLADETPAAPVLMEEESVAPAVMDEEPVTPVVAEEERPAPVDETETAALAPVAPPVPDHIPELAALPNETPILPEDEEISSVPSAVREALKSRFDTAYGSPNRIDLLAPLRQTRHFDPGRFDIFEEPAGG